jgi:hypothetical protein
LQPSRSHSLTVEQHMQSLLVRIDR